MEKLYLDIFKTEDGITIDSSDGVFSSWAHRANKEDFQQYCEEKANEWLNSKLGNYDGWSQRDRQTMATKWLAAKELQEGEYNYYFSLRSKEELFSEAVAELAKELGVNYELTLKRE